MEDTVIGEWTIRSETWTIGSETWGAHVTATSDDGEWFLTPEDICAETTQGERGRGFMGDCPNNRYLPLAVLREMLRRLDVMTGPGAGREV